MYTRCPETRTACPPTRTDCAGEATKCPIAETRCPTVETRCPPPAEVTFIAFDGDGLPTAGARVVVWQPGLRSSKGETDKFANALLKGLFDGYLALVYAVSPDGEQAAFTAVGLVNSRAQQRVEIRLAPARTGTIVLEDEAGNELPGTVTVYLSKGEAPPAGQVRQEGRDAVALFDVPIAGETRVKGLLPGVRYLVRARVKGYVQTGADPWVEWSFRKDDAQPTLILRFEKERP